MTPFATVVELEEFLGVDFRPSQYPGAERALKVATSLIQNEARQTFSRVAADAITLRGTRGEQLVLPQRPVNALVALGLEDTTVAVTGLDWDRWGRLRWKVGSAFTSVWLAGGNTGDPVTLISEPLISVTYDHGYVLNPSEIPDPNPLGLQMLPEDIRSITLSSAARGMGNPEGLGEESLGGYDRIYSGSAALTPKERRVLGRYRPVNATVQIGH